MCSSSRGCCSFFESEHFIVADYSNLFCEHVSGLLKITHSITQVDEVSSPGCILYFSVAGNDSQPE